MDLSKSGRFKRISLDRRVAHKRISNPGMQMKRRTGVVERVRVRAREMSLPPRSVRGAARVVASRLPIAKIMIVFGLVVFATFGILIGANAYAQSRKVTIRLDNGIYKTDVQTTARTVRDLLDQCHLRIGPNDVVTPAQNSRLSDGMAVMISRAMIVYITSKGEMKQQYMTGGTVQDALAKAGVDYDQDDVISPSLSTNLFSGMRITHIAVQSEVITESEHINYSTVYKNSSQLLKGQTSIINYGKQGEQTKQIQVTYKDGLEVNRVEISSITTTQPVSRYILIGTGTPQKPPKTGGSGKSGNSGNSGNTGKSGNSGSTGNSGGTGNSASDGSTNYGGHYSNVKPEDLVVPPAPAQFQTIYYMTITAYTHTGHKTAAAGWPQYTRTLSKPGTIAVDPKSIPYGTLLYVTGYGYCVAEDTGSNTTDSSRMGDVFMNTKADCYKWGRRRNVTVYVVQSNFKR